MVGVESSHPHVWTSSSQKHTWVPGDVHGLQVPALDDRQRESACGGQVAEWEHDLPEVDAFLQEHTKSSGWHLHTLTLWYTVMHSWWLYLLQQRFNQTIDWLTAVTTPHLDLSPSGTEWQRMLRLAVFCRSHNNYFKSVICILFTIRLTFQHSLTLTGFQVVSWMRLLQLKQVSGGRSTFPTLRWSRSSKEKWLVNFNRCSCSVSTKTNCLHVSLCFGLCFHQTIDLFKRIWFKSKNNRMTCWLIPRRTKTVNVTRFMADFHLIICLKILIRLIIAQDTKLKQSREENKVRSPWR